jgi:hypothetical protein
MTYMQYILQSCRGEGNKKVFQPHSNNIHEIIYNKIAQVKKHPTNKPTKYHITNKCTNCILCISLKLCTLNHFHCSYIFLMQGGI